MLGWWRLASSWISRRKRATNSSETARPGEDLHGLGSVGDSVADLVDLAHSSGAEDACDFVVADLVSDSDGHVLSAHFTGSSGPVPPPRKKCVKVF